MQNLILAVILLAILFLAARYVYKAKKNGQKCIGCPHGGKCGTAENEYSPCCGCSSSCER